MNLSIEMRARMIRDAGAGQVFGPARFDAIEAEARTQIREAVTSALRKHGIRPEHDSFYDGPTGLRETERVSG
jgi:hypothetical protein